MNVRLIIPMCPTRLAAIPARYLERIAHITGSFTSFNGHGGWINPKGNLITEPVLVVETSIGKDNSNAINQLRQVAVKVCSDLDQECVFISFDGEAHYILKDGSDMTPT